MDCRCDLGTICTCGRLYFLEGEIEDAAVSSAGRGSCSPGCWE